MYCKYCGKELPVGSEFCSNCGEKISETTSTPKPTSRPTPRPTPGPARRPGQSDVVAYMKYVGIISPILSVLTFFLKWMKLKSDLLSGASSYFLGKDSSFTYLSICKESGHFILMMLLTLIPVVLVIVLQLMNHPRLSLIGWAGMGIPLVLVGSAMNAGAAYAYKTGAGHSLYLFLYILIFLAGIMTKTPKNENVS